MVFPISLTLEIYGVLLIIILGKVLMEIDFNKQYKPKHIKESK